MEIRTTSIELKQAIQRIKSNKYILPKFQRDFTWSKNKIGKLKESILLKHPIGAITLYKKGPKSIIIDGQQRLTSILEIDKDKEFLEENYNYKIPVMQWDYSDSDNENESIAKFFVDMNDHASPLDKDDITLAMLSEEKIAKPDWFDQDYEKLIKKMYSNRNSHIGVENVVEEKITILESLWILSQKVKVFNKNHDKNIMTYLTHRKSSEKVKYKLVWMKRVISLLCHDDINKMNYHENSKDFLEKLRAYLSKIMLDKNLFFKFADKLNMTFKEMQSKFNFILNVPTNQSSMDREVINKWIAKDYVPIYILAFLYQNKQLYESGVSQEKLFKQIETFKIKGVDLINFMSQKLISAGGYNKWLQIIVKDNQKLFYVDTKDNLEKLLLNMFDQTTTNNDKPNKMTKVVCIWLASNVIPEKIFNKKEWYEIDHIIPRKYCKTSGILNFSSLANCDILNNNDNQDKNSQLTSDYIHKSFINKKYKYSYQDVVDKINAWKENPNSIKHSEFNSFIEHRKEFIKNSIKLKIQEEMS